MGNWKVRGNMLADSNRIIVNKDGDILARIHGADFNSDEEMEVTATLIASAPDLLEELVYIYNAYDLGETDKFRIKKAIEKASK